MITSIDDVVPRLPDPGSEAAASIGCLCDPVANEALPRDTWLIAAGCPVHAPHRQEHVA